MATKNLIPRSDGEGGIGIPTQAWGDAYFKSGHFSEDLTLEGNPVLTGEVNDLSTNVTWVNVPDVNISASSVTQHQGSLSLTSSQINDLGSQGFLTSFTEVNDLSTNVTWANVPDVNISSSSVTQHQGSLSLTSSQISNFQSAAEALSGNYKIDSNQLTFNNSILPELDATYDIGSANNRVRDLYLTNNSLHLGDATLSSDGSTVNFPSGIVLGGTESISLDTDENGRLLLGPSGLKVGEVELKPDPDNPKSLFFNEIPQVKDAEGNAVTVLTADKLGLGTSNVLTGIDQDLVFKLLTDEQRFVIGTTGDYGLESGWYRFNDFKVKGATDIGAHAINPVDTRIYSDESSFILFTTDTAGNRVAHLVGGEEEVNANNAIALGIAVKVDDGDTPSDIEFVHTDGESYSVINGNSDSLGTNGLPIRQGFQSPSLGSNPSPLLIDGGYF
jgi:hypothetical protein